MKNSTFSAQVANNLLTVLQGYTKGIRLIALLTMLCTIGVGQMWGAEETIKWNSYTSSGTGSTLTITWDGNNSCTITQSKGDNTSNNVSTSYATSPRWYQYHHVTFTPKTGCTITQVVLTGSGSSYNGQDMSFVTGTGTISKSGNATTITGSWDSTFKLKMGKQFRPGTVVVTYTTSSGGGSDPTPVDPTATFSNGEYTVGGAALDLSTLWDSNSTGAVTYSVTNAGTTGASISGTSFTATAAGSCTVQASQAAATGYNAITKTATITVNPAQGGGSGSGDNYTITFATGTNTTATTSSVQLSTMISDGDENVKSFVVDGTDKYVYHKGAGASNATGSGLRLGKSRGKGKITFNLSDEIAAQNLSSISVTTAAWDASTTVSLVVNGSATTTANAGNTIAYTPSTTTKLSSITLSATARAFIKTITITTSSSAEPTQLPAPTGLTATNITSTSATLSWNAVANASSYVVQILDDGNTNIEQSTTNTTITVTGLNPSTLHYWGVTAVGDGTTYTDSEESETAEFTTSAAASPATITLSELGVTTTDNTTYSVGDQYTLPTISSQSCAGKQLVGWSTVEVAETDTKPTSNYYELGAEVTLAATQTFYAVFAAGSGGGGEGWTAVTSTSDLEAGATYAISSAATEGTYLSTWDGGNNFPGSTSIICPLILGGSAGAWTFQIADGGTYNNRFLTATNTTEKNYLKAVTTADAYSVFTISFDATNKNAVITCTGKASRNILRYNANNGSPIFACYTSGQSATYLQKYATGGGGYSAYSTSCIPTYSITYDFAGGTGSHCSNTSVPQGDSYTICDEEPTKEGYTFLGWSDGTTTYAAGVTITPTGNVTLTAQWQIKTYTVTWSAPEGSTAVPYNHGVALVVPDAPASCDGVKEFVGWTTHSGYYHATTAPDDIFTTKTTPVTATATYYAVFATPGAGGTEFVLGESGTFKMYANVDGTNHYAQGGVSSSKLSSTTDILTASDYTLTYADGSYTIKQGTSAIGHSSKTDLTSTAPASTWTISEGANGSWRITSDKDNSRALSYSAEANAFKAYATSNLTTGNETYFDIEFGSGSDAHSDYTTICQTVESIEIANYTTEFFVTDEFAFGGTVTAHFDGGGTQDVTALAHFSGYNMNVTGTYTITVTYMGATATYEINVKPLDNAWVLTWNVSGKTNTGLGPRSVTKGSAIGTLPTPIVPDACAGKTFMGWTESNVVNSDGSGITYINEGTVPTANTTYYAVFATVNNFCTQKPIDQITPNSKVVIVAVASLDAGGTTGKAISSRTAADGNNLASDDVFVLDEQINTPHSTCVWTLTRESGKYIFTQDGKYLNAIEDPDKTTSGFCKFNSTKDTWTISESSTNTYRMLSSNENKYVEWFTATGVFKVFNVANTFGTFDMQFFVTANANGEADITDYTTGCAEYTITYYGFQGGYSTSCSSDGTIVLPVNSLHTIPNCGDVVKDHTNLNRTFTSVWMTKPHGGHTFKPGDTFILTQDTTLYAQWELNTQNDFTTLPTDVEDLAGTDIYVYGGKTLTLQPGTTTINSLTLKGGIQTDGSYQMPSVWVPEGATLVRNSNKIYLDLVVNAENWYPFAVPFETKNTSDIHYLHPDMKSAAKYSKHFDIKTYDGARRADVGEDKANNWVRLKRHTAEDPVSFKPGVGYIISAMAYPGTDTATIRIPMTVPNTWFKNGEQAVVGTTVRNTIDVTAHTGEAATEHQRHAGWNFVANPYLSNFTGGGIDASNGLDYIDGELIIQGSYEYSEETVPYVTIPAYNFAYYSQHKLSEVKLSPEWSFFVQVGTSGTMDFTTTGRQQAPASIAARAEERPVKMDVDITLSDNHSSDQTGIIISDRYNDTYEIGRDLEKLFGSAYNLSVYTLMADNTPLAFQALAIRSSMQVIPVGYRAPEQGEYTFRLNEATSSIDLLNEQYEQLVLVDYQTGELTNLLISDYTFYSERTQADNRFAIYAVPRQNAPTDLPNAIGQDKEAQKIIHNGHLYILRDGNVYNGNGQIVK